MKPLLKYIIVMLATLLVSLLFNAWAADSINLKHWHPQSIFISVLYSVVFLIFYLVYSFKDNDFYYHEYSTDEEEKF